jgi:hypothetical protein
MNGGGSAMTAANSAAAPAADQLLVHRLNWYALPPSIQRIAERCGADVASALLEKYNGLHVLVPLPKTLFKLRDEQIRLDDLRGKGENSPAMRMMDDLGFDNALRLSRQYPGQCITVPRAYHAFLRLRNDALRTERQASGLGTVAFVAHVARREGLTERAVYKILRGVKIAPDPRQFELL